MTRRHSVAGTTLARATAVLLALTFVHPLWAAPGDITMVPTPALGADPPKAHDIADGDSTVSMMTGAFSYSYPIVVPPGRLGVQPQLALTYSSQAPLYGGVAMGWSLQIPTIELDTSRSLAAAYLQGIDFRDGPFVSNLAGGRPLVEVSEPAAPDVVATYRAKNDASWARYERMVVGSPYRWRVRVPDGKTYYFGDTSLAASATIRWTPLTRIEDAYGNTVEFAWTDWSISQIRYTSNPTLGMPAFARVEFDWTPGPQCTLGLEHVGAQEDGPRGIVSGRLQLSKIRAIAQVPGKPIEHTRELTLTYSSELARCDLKRAPMRVLEGIQESAWGDTEPRVDLPPVTFEYNRFERTFPSTSVPAGMPWSGDPIPSNLGWGTRPDDSSWPTVEGMFLDLDGDGLQDRVYAPAPSEAGNECMFVWRKNLGRNAAGSLTFAAPVYRTMPRLPWADASGTKSAQESCSLSAQLTYKTNLPDGAQSTCSTTTGTYLAYRWLDMTGDELPDLVTAIHHDPKHFDPNATDWFGAWPSCTPGSTCPALSADCMDEVVDCSQPEQNCAVDHGAVNACVNASLGVACDALMRQSSPGQTQDCESVRGSDIDPNWCMNPNPAIEGVRACPSLCAGIDRLEPPHNGEGMSCSYKRAHERCDRYPWIIWENQGNGNFAALPTIKYQPVPLESDVGDSSFGGGALSSTRHAIQDIDGDGNLDAVLRGRYTERDLDIPHRNVWWLVFPGDGDGGFLTGSNGWPYVWVVPDSAPVSASCASDPGGLCTALTTPPVEADEHDVKGLSSVIDLNGDGASDLVWKVAADQFSEPDAYVTWNVVSDDDPIVVYRGNNRQFEFRGSLASPEGSPLAWSGVAQFSRSHVDATAHTANHHMAVGYRKSLARFVDVDMDGRPDLLEQGRTATGYDFTPSLFINGGGLLLSPIVLGAQEAERFRQETLADATGYSAPRDHGWFTKKDLLDLDGDGLPEHWNFEGGAGSYHRETDEQPMRLMKRIVNGRGGTVDIEYAPTTKASVVTQDAGARRASPRVQWVVQAMTTDDAWSPTSRTTYRYTHPVWNEDEDERWGFRGFEEVEMTTPSGSRSIELYDYNADWAGRLASTRVYANAAEEPSGGPRTIADTTWQSFTLFGGLVRTALPTATRTWACSNGQTETQCRQAASGLVKTVSTWVPMSTSIVSGLPPLMYVEQCAARQQCDHVMV